MEFVLDTLAAPLLSACQLEHWTLNIFANLTHDA
jgi:hypothetical protein